MAQTEDTELRDLVIDALEKNGSLAKIRALLRANVFLAFEDDFDTENNNVYLDAMLKHPQGILSLTLVHEFLEYCNLKNTLFVYKSETRQGREYTFDGSKLLAEKLKIDRVKEPLLVSLLKTYQKRTFNEKDQNQDTNLLKSHNGLYKDSQNCTYIVHEDSSNTSSQSNTQSDNSSDEKNKLHLRLPLDNSDTDTSSDSTRGKTSSEYIPNENIVIQDESDEDNRSMSDQQQSSPEQQNRRQNVVTSQVILSDLGIGHNSSDSTSYVELKPYNPTDTVDIPGNPDKGPSQHLSLAENHHTSSNVIIDRVLSTSKPLTTSTMKNPVLTKTESDPKSSPEEIILSNTPDYSYDFTASASLKQKETESKDNVFSPDPVRNYQELKGRDISIESTHQNSHSSRSSVSISDVADLLELSEANSPLAQNSSNTKKSPNSSELKYSSSNKINGQNKHKTSIIDDKDLSESTVPSLTNLSLDFHSD